MKTIRLLPLVALAAFFMLALKLAGMMMGENALLTGSAQTMARPSPGEGASLPTGEQKTQKSDEKIGNGSLAAKRIGAKNPDTPKDIVSLLGDQHRSRAEIKLLTSLSGRRKQLDQREKELELRLNLIRAAEKRINERIGLLKRLEEKIQRFSAARKKEKNAQFARLVRMYSSMKPKGAARIFNELDNRVLLQIIKNMKPQVMSAILAAMAPQKAREMTIALAGDTQKKLTEKSLEELPKINGN